MIDPAATEVATEDGIAKDRRHARFDRGATAIVVVAILVALAIGASGPGYRFGLWPLSTAFILLRWGAWIALVVAAIAVAMVWFARRRHGVDDIRVPGVRRFSSAIVISLAAAALPLWLTYTASQVPPIHDITTDMANPPAFVAIAPLRASARNPVTYEGEKVASQQRTAYPDIKPATLAMPAAQAFERALTAARSMGWTIIDTDAAAGRIEASDTTPFFGFTDDVVIQVTAEGNASRVDVRSKSRIGRSDIGANARRVRRYIDKLQG